MNRVGNLFAKRICVYIQDFDEQGRDLGEEEVVLCLDKQLILASNHPRFWQKHIKTFDIKKIVVFRGASLGLKKTVEDTIGGWMVAGPIGAFYFGLAAARKKSWWCEVEEHDGTTTLFRLETETQAEQLKKWKRIKGY